MNSKQFNLPLFPGYSSNSNIGKEYFGKKQQLTISKQNVCMIRDNDIVLHRPQSLYSTCFSPDGPPWLLFDKQILTFEALFENDNPYEQAYTRMVKIMFFLEDNTMKVVEPKTNNSGLYQGTIVAKQRVPLPNNETQYYEVIDLNVGKEIDIFKKKFLIIDCDKFTRSFLTKLGVKVPEAIPIKSHIYNKDQAYSGQTSIYEKELKKQSVQFLKNDGKILRFTAYWDDRQAENSKLYNLEVLYYLADDTMEIKELFPTSSGHTKRSVFVRRGPLPKKIPECLIASHNEPLETYSATDLVVGSAINVYGRTVFLTDCDSFTKEYYRLKYGIDNFEKINPTTSSERIMSSKRPRQCFPWNGFGSHKDSACNCDTIDPKPPNYDFYKFLEKDSSANESHILRYVANLVTDIIEYKMRRFIINYYLKDDTISVFEVPCRNSGFKGGMFFKRNLVVLPGQDFFVSEPPICYTVQDMWIGNILLINDFKFHLVDADDYTLRYMEQNSEEFEKANVTLIIGKIKEKFMSKENMYKDFIANNMQYLRNVDICPMPIQHFEATLKEIVGDVITEHEFITLSRFFKNENVDLAPKRENIRSLIHASLVRNLWQNNVFLSEHLSYLDETKNGHLPYQILRGALIANKLPVPNDELDKMLSVIIRDENGDLSIQDVLDFLNFKLKPPQAFIAVPAKSTKQIQRFSPQQTIPNFRIKDLAINFEKFVECLNLEHLICEETSN